MSVTGKTFSELTTQQQVDMRDAIRGYKVYRAILKGNGASNPTVTVIENTIGVDITWTAANSGGIYVGAINGYPNWYPSIGLSPTYSRISIEIQFYSELNNINSTNVILFASGATSIGPIGIALEQQD